MAKISANGAYKVAESKALRRIANSDHTFTVTRVLTSDGRILMKITRPGESGAYSVVARLKSRDGHTPQAVEIFRRYVESRHHAPDSVRVLVPLAESVA